MVVEEEEAVAVVEVVVTGTIVIAAPGFRMSYFPFPPPLFP